jgi:hypothetical protein
MPFFAGKNKCEIQLRCSRKQCEGQQTEKAKTRRKQTGCYDFKNIFAEKIVTKLAFFTRNKAKLCKNLIITLVFEKRRQYFSPKIVKNRRKM